MDIGDYMQLKKGMEFELQTFDLEDVERLSEPIFEACLSYVNSHLTSKELEKIDVKYQVGFFDDDRVSAYADKKEGGYIVKINMATWFIIYSFCHCIIMQPIVCDALSFKNEMSQESKMRYANILTTMMMKILFYHELGHIFNGHIDYIKNKESEYIKNNPDYSCKNENAFSYEGRKARPFVSTEMWQALEWNADDFAASRMVGQYTFDENIQYLGLFGKEHSLLFLVVAYVSLFTLMEMGIKVLKPEEYKDKEHLPKRIRLNKSIESMFAAYKEFNSLEISLEASDVEENYVPCIENWTEAFMRTYFKDYDVLNLKTDMNIDELDEQHMHYYNRVDNFYARNLIQELAPYTYCEVQDAKTTAKGNLLNLISNITDKDINEIEIEYIIRKSK